MPSFKVYKGSPAGIKEGTTTKEQLVGDQVLVRVKASGVCFADTLYQHTDMVFGHEGMGVVQEVGAGVKGLRVGDRVGWGYQTNSCGVCQQCLSGNDDYCAEREFYGMANLDQGSFAEAAVWKEGYLFKIPDNISDIDAGP
jgi:D-arabinose 1-dehydrogenase-like Zn-dependent alcohol dehydrogenase